MPLELILRNYIITSGLAARPNPSVKGRSNGGQFPIRRSTARWFSLSKLILSKIILAYPPLFQSFNVKFNIPFDKEKGAIFNKYF